MKNRKLKLNRQIVKQLVPEALRTARGGEVHWTEPYSFCGMCIPITYMSCKERC